MAGPLSAALWQTGPDGSFHRAAEIVAAAATEAAAAAAAAVVAAAGTKIREQMDALQSKQAGEGEEQVNVRSTPVGCATPVVSCVRVRVSDGAP